MVKSNKLFKILAVVLAILCIVSISGIVNAQPVEITPNTTGVDTGKITGITGTIVGVIQVLGFAAGVIIIAYMGVKYITASPDGKAEIKKQAAVYILGAAFIMLAPTIAKLVFQAIAS